MPSTITYTQARVNLAKICDMVANNQEVVIINRRNAEPVAPISASELSGLIETVHLLRSPKNAERLLNALNRAKSGAKNYSKSTEKPKTSIREPK